MTKTLKASGIAVLAVLVIGLILSIYNLAPSFSSAPDGIPATVATTSAPTVGTTAVRVFATSTCAARIITTYASPVMLTFTDLNGDVPSAILGHLQPASTTVSYDSGQYGCNAVRAFSFVADDIWVSESR